MQCVCGKAQQLVFIGNRMNVSAVKDLHYKTVIFENSLKIAWAFEQVQFERISKLSQVV